MATSKQLDERLLKLKEQERKLKAEKRKALAKEKKAQQKAEQERLKKEMEHLYKWSKERRLNMNGEAVTIYQIFRYDMQEAQRTNT